MSPQHQQLQELSKLAWRALVAADRVIETIVPDSDDEAEKLMDLMDQIHEATQGLTPLLMLTAEEKKEAEK